MSDSDSDGYGSPKRRRYNDEADEGEEEDVADEQEPEGGIDLDDSDEEDYSSKKPKKKGTTSARDFINDMAEVSLRFSISECTKLAAWQTLLM